MHISNNPFLLLMSGIQDVTAFVGGAQ